jgi:Na+-transporting methylmalonyl-CoA/oxaloacetate decarboxylase gamma subunit
METVIWIITFIVVILIVVIYMITSVGKYSNSFVGRFFKDKSEDKKAAEKKKSSE